MELEFRFRNNDMGPVVPTFQERVNGMLSAQASDTSMAVRHNSSAAEASAATVLQPVAPSSPRMLNDEEIEEALKLVEREAEEHSLALIEAHSGLTDQRVARLLGLLN